MQTKISTTESSLLSSGLLFDSKPTGPAPIDPPDNTGPGTTTSTQPEEEETAESQ